MNYVIFPILQNEQTTEEVICKFKIKLDDVIGVYDYEIAYNKKIYDSLPPLAPRREEFEAIKKIRNELNEHFILKEDIEYHTPKYMAVFVGKLIFNKKFESVYCCKCSGESKPNDVLVKSWVGGESLFAEGGRTVSCKNGHELFKMMEWNS